MAVHHTRRSLDPLRDADAEVALPRWNWQALLWQAGFFCVLALTGWLMWLFVDLGFYTRQEVRISHVGEYCFLQFSGRRRGWFEPQLPRPTEDCAGLRKRVAHDRSFYRYRVVRDRFVSFDYLSPADGALHPGMLRRSLNDAGQPAKAGDGIIVHASRLFAVTYTDWSSRNPPN